MGIAIAEYAAGFEPAVRDFNLRLERGGIRYRFPETCLESGPDAAVSRRGFVAVQDGAQVRGGYLLKEQDFVLHAGRAQVGYIHLPLSEGLVDRSYGTLGAQLMAHALRRQPLMFGLGIGGRTETFARMIAALGWSIHDVPFYFKVVRPGRVARGLVHVRRTPARRLLLDAAAWSGAAWLAVRCADAMASTSVGRDYTLELSPSAEAWADGRLDDLWDQCRSQFVFAGWRDRRALAALYGDPSSRFLRFHFARGGRPVGWAVALATPMAGHRHFGNLHVGTIVDCMALPPHARPLVAAVSAHLVSLSVDLIVTNQSARPWTEALAQAGFRPGPSNFLFASSPRLTKALGSVAAQLPAMHLTRGDGDGPINL